MTTANVTQSDTSEEGIAPPAESATPERAERTTVTRSHAVRRARRPRMDRLPATATTEPRHRVFIAGRFNGPWSENARESRAKLLASGRGVPRHLRDDAGAVAAYIEYAEMLDIPLGAALQNVFMATEGKNAGTIGIKAQFMVGLALRAGYRIIQLHLDEIKCVLRLQRPDGTITPQVMWHKLRAQRAGLFGRAGGDNPWVLYTEDMLWARAVSQLLRRWAPHVTGGLHTVDELDMDALDDMPQLDEHGIESLEPLEISAKVQDYLAERLGGGDFTTVEGIQEALRGSTLDALRAMAVELPNAGLENAYAGAADGIHHMLSELVYEAGMAASMREQAAGTLLGGGVPHEERQHLDEGHQADDADARDAQAQLPVLQQPAGQGGALPCRCDVLATVTTGKHQPDVCTLPPNMRDSDRRRGGSKGGR
jgi:hypothetical protein